MKGYKWLFILMVSAMSPWVVAKHAHVAVASNFNQTMQALVKEFEKTSEYKVVLSFGSSGKFYAQIRHGAPYDVFFSADQAKPLALQKAGLIVASSRLTYAIGRLAVWSAKADFQYQVEARFKKGDFNQLALANPKLAPYGAAAKEVLDNLNLAESSQKKWIKGENIAQTYQFVDSGNADLGFVALPQLLAKRVAKGTYWVVPKALHRPIKQDVVWLKKAEDNQAAKALMLFIRTDIARHIITQHAYIYPKVYK